LSHLLEGAANSRIRLASEQAAFAVMLTISHHSLTDPIISIGLQQKLHHVFDRWSNEALHIERFVWLVSERTQRG